MNALHMPPAPQGTILPGTTIQLGRYTVVIDRYIAEGGFAHVYVGSIVNNGVVVPGFPVVIKRIAVADKERLAVVNSEIETMKRLGKHKNIVEYMDSCMGKLEHGGYEVLILMEYCGGGPVIDLMNRRLQHRLTEPEILKIFSNVCEAVAYLHYCDPPILHRDIKVENILLSNNDYKLCDFGSATTNILRGDNIPRNVKDIQLLEEEINNHTTLQYRAPEMLDLYMRKGIDEKIDIWALGVLLYKLCYYTTPFEEQGQLAILNVRYTIPDHPVFSPALIGLFQSMLKEDPRQRPNIYQVTKMTSTLRGLPCPIQNKYPDSSMVSSAPEINATANILSHQPVVRPMDILPSIEPMRRGRPTRSPAPTTPAMTSNSNYTSTFPSTTSQAADFSAGFDDSFGQFTQNDPASQFSKISPTGDAFDFGGSPSSSANNNSSIQAKRSTFDFQSANGANGKDEFGFDLPSTSGDLLHPEPQQPFSGRFKNSMPAQLSGNNQGFSSPTPSNTATKAKPTANDLFFGSSAGMKFENTDSGSRSDSPASFSSTQPPAVGLSSPLSNTDSSGMSKPLLGSRLPSQGTTPKPYQSYQSPNPALNRSIHSDGTGNSRLGYSGVSSPNVPPRATSSMGATSTSGQGVDLLMTKMESMDLLQRQQVEQLGQFNSVESSGIISAQNTQGKARVSDSNRTLDGLRSMDVGYRTGSSAGPVVTPPLAPRPQMTASSVSSPNPKLPPLDRSNMAKRDMDAELKLIQLQQKEFEKQQQELIQLQRTQLEEQQRQHRLQQDHLQKQQQQQIQLQHEKWQERKRMLKEQEQLAQTQLSQQQDLQQQHQTQQRQQQQQQQQQYIPATADSVSSSSSGNSPSSANAYRQSYSGPSSVLGTPAMVDRFTSLPRSSLDEHERYKAPTSQSSTTSNGQSPLIDTSTPAVPVKSARRAGVNGGAATANAPVKVARRTSFNNSNLPPGQKPELLPKPTRFRMKDGTGTLMTGEEEAFKKKFPSADIDDDLMQFQTPASPVAPVSSSYSAPYYGAKDNSPVSASSSGDELESPAPSSSSSTAYGRTTTATTGSIDNNSQYQSPSQRAREISQQQSTTRRQDDDDEEEEPLVRSRRRHQTTPGGPASPLAGAGAGGKYELEDGEEAGAPIESVRERVQRMNRVGRVV
ncbi:hypothetical protein BGX24_011195 [Mortierella sp. AD032]|nr:hypothetical protein BGX24_011195 [Mortierella sp. AD032]